MSRLLIEFIKKPFCIGAVWPSSRFLARRMMEGLGVEEAKTVVELGPGTGPMTAVILPRLGSESSFIAVESNSCLVQNFQKRFPDVHILHENAANLVAILANEGLPHADVIVSGLPWCAFSGELQDEILSAVVAALPSGGVFTTFTYIHSLLLPAEHRFHKKLNANFTTVRKTPVTWFNFPPAFCYRCYK